MTGNSQPEVPCLVETRQGFSVLYKERYLYSKYNPSSTILRTIENLQILSGTLILCASPCLWYGLDQLIKKLPDNCFIAGIEADDVLYNLAKEKLSELKKTAAQTDSPLREKLERTVLLSLSGMQKIHTLFSSADTTDNALPPVHTFKRAVMIEFSAGTALFPDQYKNTVYNAEAVIARFWKNRITLVKLGRLFSRNVFKNLKNLNNAHTLSDYKKRITKPIIVFGAGESAEVTLKKIQSYCTTNGLKDDDELPWYILCVDAALGALKKYGIKADGVVAVESQLAIEKAYIGNPLSKTVIFADLSSRPSVTRHTASGLCFFTSEYTDAAFLRRLEKAHLLPCKIDAMGSVGLVAVHIAGIIRSDETVPVFVTGLDFSYSLGKTHAKGTYPHTERLIKTSRLSPIENYDAAFKTGAAFADGKNGTVITDSALRNYASSFIQFFHSEKNLFDAGKTGLPLQLPLADDDFLNTCTKGITEPSKKADFRRVEKKDIAAFLAEEKYGLTRIKEILINGKAVQKQDITIEQELHDLLKEREYLYLHFPDGYECKSDDISFLKRVRSEIDFFLKDFD